MTTYGATSHFLVQRGDGTLHKEQRSMRQHDRDHTGNFTQVRAVVRRKTLLCFGGLMVDYGGKRNVLAQQGCLGTRTTTRV